MSLYLYLGGQGSNYTSVDKAKDPVPGGWNFGGKGGLDFADSGGTNGEQPESGAGGGGGVDIRLEYYDINSNPLNDSALMSSIKSRIIVAGSGGGSCAGDRPMGMSGGDLEAPTNNKFMFGGSQTLGNLGVGIDGIQTSDNKGGTGGFGSGYRGGYYDANHGSKESYFEYGGTGGSSYISGHPGCKSVSPDSLESDRGPVHFSNIFFTNTIMLSGDILMLQPDGTYNTGHYGHGACKITIISLNCQTLCICRASYINYFLFIIIDLSSLN